MITASPQKAEKDRQTEFNQALGRISKAWPHDALLSTLAESHPVLNNALAASQDALDEVWKACRLGWKEMPDFRAALLDWEKAHRNAIKALGKR